MAGLEVEKGVCLLPCGTEAALDYDPRFSARLPAAAPRRRTALEARSGDLVALSGAVSPGVTPNADPVSTESGEGRSLETRTSAGRSRVGRFSAERDPSKKTADSMPQGAAFVSSYVQGPARRTTGSRSPKRHVQSAVR